ncbi:hypothetical protein A4A49_51672 [Nicotiana attenuata]|uniref:Uncharacterized protein n=1 Tax=Nicotiana attenuata TaxID=49451 RepID=A0A314LBV6_NICAT|nr:hypothetical protein A4A49_51672 [Nicotiana attenuata]
MAALQVASKAIQSGSIGSEKKKNEEVSAISPYYQLKNEIESLNKSGAIQWTPTPPNVNRSTEAARVSSQKTPMITVQLKPTLIVKTYEQQPSVATSDEEEREYKIVPQTCQQKVKAKMTDFTADHCMTRTGKGTYSKKKYKKFEGCRILEECVNQRILRGGTTKKDVLMKMLSGASVPSNTSSEALAATIGKMGLGHNKALHITVKCGDKVVSRVLVDGRSGVNTCPLYTLQELGIHLREFKESHVRVRAFDGSQKDFIGEIYLALQIGAIELPILFQEMDISSSYNLLLGRTWIYKTGAVPSTLHECMKFEWGCQGIVIHGEWSQSAYLEHAVPFIKTLDDVAFHAIDIMQTIEIEETEQNLGMQSPYRSKMFMREMIKYGSDIDREPGWELDQTR